MIVLSDQRGRDWRYNCLYLESHSSWQSITGRLDEKHYCYKFGKFCKNRSLDKIPINTALAQLDIANHRASQVFLAACVTKCTC